MKIAIYQVFDSHLQKVLSYAMQINVDDSVTSRLGVAKWGGPCGPARGKKRGAG